MCRLFPPCKGRAGSKQSHVYKYTPSFLLGMRLPHYTATRPPTGICTSMFSMCRELPEGTLFERRLWLTVTHYVWWQWWSQALASSGSTVHSSQGTTTIWNRTGMKQFWWPQSVLLWSRHFVFKLWTGVPLRRSCKYCAYSPYMLPGRRLAVCKQSWTDNVATRQQLYCM